MSDNKIIDMNSRFVRILACVYKLDNFRELEESCIPHHEGKFHEIKKFEWFSFF